MGDIEQLQQRIATALDRVAYGVSKLPDENSHALEQTEAALAQEKQTSQALELRIEELTATMTDLSAQKEQAELLASEAQDEMQARLSDLDNEMQKLRQANDKLRQNNQALREANQNGVGNAHLINMSIVAELESLRAARQVERAEADAILAALSTVLKGEEESSNG